MVRFFWAGEGPERLVDFHTGKYDSVSTRGPQNSRINARHADIFITIERSKGFAVPSLPRVVQLVADATDDLICYGGEVGFVLAATAKPWPRTIGRPPHRSPQVEDVVALHLHRNLFARQQPGPIHLA